MIVVLMISIISFRPDDQIEIKMPPAYTDLYASGTQTANYCREDECSGSFASAGKKDY